MDEKITAEWARNESNKVLGVKVKTQLDACEKAIKSAVNRNDTFCTVFIIPHERVFKELFKRGFKVEEYVGSNQRDSSYITIHW